MGTNMDVLEYVDFAFYDILTREPDKALVVAQKAYQARKVPYIGLLTAVLADGLDNVAERDALLEQVVNTTLPDNYEEAPAQNFYKRLAVSDARHGDHQEGAAAGPRSVRQASGRDPF